MIECIEKRKRDERERERERQREGNRAKESERRERKKFSPEVNKDFMNSCSSVEGCISLPV
jgi:hypothetical protein